MRVFRSVLLDHLRKKKRHILPTGGTEFWRRLSETPEDSVESSLDEFVSPKDKQPLVRRAVETVKSEFSPETWQAFERTALENRNSTEVAAELQTTPNAVRKAKARVLSRLREELAGLFEDGSFES